MAQKISGENGVGYIVVALQPEKFRHFKIVAEEGPNLKTLQQAMRVFLKKIDLLLKTVEYLSTEVGNNLQKTYNKLFARKSMRPPQQPMIWTPLTFPPDQS